MKRYFVASIVLTVLLASCHTKAITQTATASAGTTSNSVTVDEKADLSATGAPYSVDSMLINKDVLSIFVNYGGGCKEHTFELISNGMYSKSLPPQVGICLKHTNNEDKCRELVMRELKFNIAKLKYPGSKTVLVKLGDKQVTYSPR